MRLDSPVLYHGMRNFPKRIVPEREKAKRKEQLMTGRARNPWVGLATALAATLAVATKSEAKEKEGVWSQVTSAMEDVVQIHGFGGWGYGISDNNTFLNATPEGNYEDVELALNVTARPMDKLAVVVQPFWEMKEGEDEAELDYAFAEWTFSDHLKMRVGRVKSPFGIYGEIYNVGTLRAFYTLPPANYRSNRLAIKAYNGVGVTGTHFMDNGWGVRYDLYGGQYDMEDMAIPVPGLPDRLPVEPTYEDMVGGKLDVYSPVEGLRFGFSGYTGDVNVDSPIGSNPLGISGQHYVMASHLEYLKDPWLVRTEYQHLRPTSGDDLIENCAYVEVAYRLDEHWQVAALVDWGDISLGDPLFEASLDRFDELDHEGFALGLNYWFTPNLVVRTSYHFTHGNSVAAFSQEERTEWMMTGDDGEDTTHSWILGAQFSF